MTFVLSEELPVFAGVGIINRAVCPHSLSHPRHVTKEAFYFNHHHYYFAFAVNCINLFLWLASLPSTEPGHCCVSSPQTCSCRRWALGTFPNLPTMLWTGFIFDRLIRTLMSFPAAGVCVSNFCISRFMRSPISPRAGITLLIPRQFLGPSFFEEHFSPLCVCGL